MTPGVSYGCVYIATGPKYLFEASLSMDSLREHMPNVPVCCFTDDPAAAARIFPHVERIENPSRNFLEKIPPLSRTPYERTIFLDTDIIITADISDLFDLLEKYDIAAAPDPFGVEADGCPACFQHLNTGLIAYRRNPAVLDFFERWFAEYRRDLAERTDQPHDQLSFQRLLYQSDLRLYVLPVEYNIRLTCPQLIRIWTAARVIHSRDMIDTPALGRRLNSKDDFRLVFPNWTLLQRTSAHVISPRSDRVLARLMAAVRLGVRCGAAVLRQLRRVRR